MLVQFQTRIDHIIYETDTGNILKDKLDSLTAPCDELREKL
jgi:hypothetical protein